MRMRRRYLLIFLFMMAILPIETMDADYMDDPDSTYLYITESGLERKPENQVFLPVTDSGDWDHFNFTGLSGSHNGVNNITLHFDLYNKAGIDLALEFMVMIDQDNDGTFEIVAEFPDVLSRGGLGVRYTEVNAPAHFLSGEFTRTVNGTAVLMVKQKTVTVKEIGISCGMDDYIKLPYKQESPVADAGEDLMGFDGRPITFDASGSWHPLDTGLEFSWDFDLIDGIQVDEVGETTEHAYAEPGNYTVTLTVSDGDHVDSDTLEVQVLERLPPVADAGKNISVDRREKFWLNASGSLDPNGDEITCKWDLGDGEIKHGMEVNHSYDVSGEHEVTLTVSDGDLFSTDNVTVVVSENIPPVAVPRLISKPMLARELRFSGEDSHDPDGDPAITCKWNFGDGSSSVGMNVTHTYYISGPVNVTLTVNDTIGSSSKDLKVTIPENQPPSANISFPHYVYHGRQCTIKVDDIYDPEGMGVIVSIDPGDGTHVDGAEVNHTYSHPGKYQIEAVLIDELDGERTIEAEVEVLDGSLFLPVTTTVEGNFSKVEGVAMGYYIETVHYFSDGWSSTVQIVKVPQEGARYYKLQLPVNNTFNISVEVLDGGNIDVLLVNKNNLDIYTSTNPFGLDRAMEWDRDGTKFNTKKFELQYNVEGSKYIIIGNNGKMDGGARPVDNTIYNISIEWTGTFDPSAKDNSWYPFLDDDEYTEEDNSNIMGILFLSSCLFLPIFFVFGILMILFAVRRKKKETGTTTTGEEFEKELLENIRIGSKPHNVAGGTYQEETIDDWVGSSFDGSPPGFLEEETRILMGEPQDRDPDLAPMPPPMDEGPEQIVSDQFSDTFMGSGEGSNVEDLFSEDPVDENIPHEDGSSPVP